MNGEFNVSKRCSAGYKNGLNVSEENRVMCNFLNAYSSGSGQSERRREYDDHDGRLHGEMLTGLG